ncbi:MAG: radical SAM protein [Oscillospiraceae bacterium]
MDSEQKSGESTERTRGTALLIAFYNKKALGVRYLQTALNRAGYEVVLVFYKDYNSMSPRETTDAELSLLLTQIREVKPVLIGLSVMSSMYLDTVHRVMHAVTEAFDIPIVCGGAYAMMFPEHFLERGSDFVVRGDGERAVCRLADAICSGTGYEDIPSLCYRSGGNNVINGIGDICEDIDVYGIPTVNSQRAVFIENDTITSGDPQLKTLSYEVIASRGCPFTCSYCCSINLRRLFPEGVKYVRTRSVKSVIDELVVAKSECKNLIFIHFYDEIFPNLPGWVDEFVKEYKKRIGLPFTIWSHPKMVDETVLKKLVSAGLDEVIMGIQSGSERIRRDVFHRYETQDEIIKATDIIKRSGVFWASYDFMVRHPFETFDDLMETYKLVKKLRAPFELQLHGLNFLPGTDIVQLALDEGLFSSAEMDDIMYAPMGEQFNAYWQREGSSESRSLYRLIYCLQFSVLIRLAEHFERDILKYEKQIDRCYFLALRLAKLRYLYKKAHIVLKSRAGVKEQRKKIPTLQTNYRHHKSHG